MSNRSNNTLIEQFVISRIKKLREDAGMSQADFAFKMELSYGFIGHVESPNHRAKYNLNHINKAVEIFDCEFSDIFPVKSIKIIS